MALLCYFKLLFFKNLFTSKKKLVVAEHRPVPDFEIEALNPDYQLDIAQVSAILV